MSVEHESAVGVEGVEAGKRVETLQFESGWVLKALYAGDLGLLKELEGRLGVRLTTRDGWLRIEGTDGGIGGVKRVFEQLSAARGRGVAIGRQEFRYAVRVVLEEDGSGGLDVLSREQVRVSPKRGSITPKTEGQRRYLESIRTKDLVFGIGPAGTGKTYLAMAMAVAALKEGAVRRIVLTRPAVEAGEALGFLPGDLRDKIMPYLRPLYDALQDMLDAGEVERFMERNVIEIAPLAYMRGRTLSNAFIVLDEAQNTTTEQMFMFLTRLGPGSKAVITGDQTQIDLPSNRRSGLIEAAQALAEVPAIGFNYFEERDVVRHELVADIVTAYRKHRGGGASGKG
jgi:phosphate starvation-inducible PhoH-like protein